MLKHIVILLLFFLSNDVIACSCVPGNVEEKFNQSKNVFIGQVNSIKFTGKYNWLGDQKTIVKFSIQKAWKSENNEITLNTADNKRSCSGYWFKENLTYLVYAYEEKGKLNTYICGGVIPESDSDIFINESTILDKLTE